MAFNKKGKQGTIKTFIHAKLPNNLFQRATKQPVELNNRGQRKRQRIPKEWKSLYSYLGCGS